MSHTTQSMVTMRIDGRTVRAKEGTFVLDAAREAGIDVPTLCNHPDLEPVGACRLCMVEVTHPEWKGWSGLMTACLYPVKDGLEVSTRSERVVSSRRGVLSLLLARCPTSDTIRKLADQYGARADGLTSDPNADSCILCGLCTRVCETYATGAITTVSRGALKRVSSFSDQPPSDCVGCGACVAVCPTHELTDRRTDADYQVWDRTFPTALCTVDEATCIGCGSCEEACPFAVARVAFRVDGVQVATIPAQFCRGCGACVGACPTGAIAQRGLETTVLCKAGEGTRVFACGRSNLKDREGARVAQLPCVGRVTVPLLLHAMATGSRGVLVLGRHQRTCRFDGAEDPVRTRVRAAQRLIALLGRDPSRIRFEEPAPGPSGPVEALSAFQAHVQQLTDEAFDLSVTIDREGLDAGMDLFEQMAKARQLDGASFLRDERLPRPVAGKPVVLSGPIPALHILGADLFAPVRMADALHASVRTLRELGMGEAGVQIGETAEGESYGFEPATGTTLLDDLLRSRGTRLPRPPCPAKVGIDGSEAQADLVRALGHEPVDVGPDPLPDRFAFSLQERALAQERLVALDRAGASALLVSGPRALARWATLTRAGAWRGSRVLPLLGVQLAHLSVLEVALGPRMFDVPTSAARVGAEVAS